MLQPHRNFNLETDFAALVRLRQEAEAVDQQGGPVTERALRAQLEWPGHQPERDRWVIPNPDQPERLIGYAMTWLRPQASKAHLYVLIHPDWRRQGLGSGLLEQASKHARALGANHLSVYANHKHPAAGLYLQKHGFQPAGAYTVLAGQLPESLPDPTWPAGWKLRPFSQASELEVSARAMTDCYEGLWGHGPVSPAQMAQWLQKWDPGGMLLVFDPSGQAIGISRVEASQELSKEYSRPTGYIDAPGWLPPFRSLENYRRLFVAGLRWLQKRGVEWVVLESWGDAPDTLEVYLGMGLELIQQDVEYVL